MEESNVKRRVGWRPDGSWKAVEYPVPEVEGARWWREGNEKRVGSARVSQEWHYRNNHILSLRSSPTTARKPANESSSGSVGFSFASTPTSTLTEAWPLSIRSSQASASGGECQKALRTRDCEMASKSISR